MGKALNLTGRVFGELTVVSEADPYYRSNGTKLRRWLCRCSCGGESTVVGQNLSSGTTKSCGCRMGKFKHGHNRAGKATPTYHTWQAMRHRCNEPTHCAYQRYGGAGVTICPEWNDPETGFANFLADMGERPLGCTLDRVDTSRGYEKSNCRWATAAEQYENKRVTRAANGRFSSNQGNHHVPNHRRA